MSPEDRHPFSKAIQAAAERLWVLHRDDGPYSSTRILHVRAVEDGPADRPDPIDCLHCTASLGEDAIGAEDGDHEAYWRVEMPGVVIVWCEAHVPDWVPPAKEEWEMGHRLNREMRGEPNA